VDDALGTLADPLTDHDRFTRTVQVERVAALRQVLHDPPLA
jgi:hypothetical protein